MYRLQSANGIISKERYRSEAQAIDNALTLAKVSGQFFYVVDESGNPITCYNTVTIKGSYEVIKEFRSDVIITDNEIRVLFQEKPSFVILKNNANDKSFKVYSNGKRKAWKL